jgi:hypothetical protein
MTGPIGRRLQSCAARNRRLPASDACSSGEIALGGCVVFAGHPTHQCTACGEDVNLTQDAELMCAGCGRPLLGDPEDDPTGESGQPLGGECVRELNFAAVEEIELLFDDGDEQEDA